MKTLLLLSTLFFFCFQGFLLDAQPSRELTGDTQVLPLRRVSLLSSGLGYFEHSGTISGPAQVNLFFDANAMNDVLASLVLNDPSSGSPSLRYNSEDSLWRSLRSLRVDLSGNPGIAELLGNQRGQEIELYAPGPIQGKIMGIEYRHQFSSQFAIMQPWLTILTDQGIRSIVVYKRFIN